MADAGSAGSSIEPAFIDSARGPLFTLLRLPPPGTAPRGAVLLVPPLAEELNRSRRGLALLGTALADAGYANLLVDLHGTGDSAGEFGDARWAGWIEDLILARTTLAARVAARPWLVGVRAGALLAGALVTAGTEPPAGLALWQPVVAGDGWLRQWLRLRTVADRFEGRETSVGGLRAELAASGAIEVGGYTVSEALAAALESSRLAASLPPAGCPVHWFDIGATPATAPAGAAAGVVEGWRAVGAAVHWHAVVDEQFWTTQEIAQPAATVAATVAVIGAPA